MRETILRKLLIKDQKQMEKMRTIPKLILLWMEN